MFITLHRKTNYQAVHIATTHIVALFAGNRGQTTHAEGTVVLTSAGVAYEVTESLETTQALIEEVV